MVALRFYANGNFQTVNGDLHGISKASVSRIVNAVSSAFVALSPNYIEFPRDDRGIDDTILGFFLALLISQMSLVLFFTKIKLLEIKICQLPYTNFESQ